MDAVIFEIETYQVKFFSFNELKLQCILKLKPKMYIESLILAMKYLLEFGNYMNNYLK